MKIKPSITTVIVAKTAITIVCFGLILIPHLLAQSADIFQSLSDSPNKTASDDLPESTTDIELLKSKPSRFAIGNIESYMTARMEDFSMKNREMDIFGIHQDPASKPVIKNTPSSTIRAPTHLAAIPLAEIIKGIKVSTVMVKEKSFLVGGRVFKQEEEFPISYQGGRVKNIKVIKVEAKKIIFKDIDAGEEAVLKLDVLPPGMESGDDRLTPAGMVAPTRNKPLVLEIN